MADMSPETGHTSFFAETLVGIRNNLEAFFLIALLWTVASLFLFLMLADEMAVMQAVDPTDQKAVLNAFMDFLPVLFVAIAIGSVLFCAVAVLWVRIVALGRARALEAGFLRRFLLALWRTVSMFGYVVLILVAVVLLSFLVTAIAAVAGAGVSQFGGLLLGAAALVVFVPVYLAYLVSVAAAALDERLPILAAAKALSGHWGPYVLLAVLAWAVSAAVSFLTNPALRAKPGGTFEPSVLQMLPGTILGAIAGLLIITASVAAYRRTVAGSGGGPA